MTPPFTIMILFKNRVRSMTASCLRISILRGSGENRIIYRQNKMEKFSVGYKGH